MDYVYDNWVDVASVIGTIATVAGLVFAIRQVVGARKAARAAESAASAAEKASVETQNAIHGVLTVSDLQRVIGYVQQIKSLHRDQKWETCLHMYQVLRASLADIHARLPDPAARDRVALQGAINQVRVIEDTVDTAVLDGDKPAGAEKFNGAMNTIQVKLEEMVSSAQVQESEVNT